MLYLHDRQGLPALPSAGILDVLASAAYDGYFVNALQPAVNGYSVTANSADARA